MNRELATTAAASMRTANKEFTIFTDTIMLLVYPQNFAYPLSTISLGTTVLLRRNWKQWFWGANKVHFGLCENGD